MSWIPCEEAKIKSEKSNAVEMVVIPRTGDIGNFQVHRALPSRERRLVGPFIFWDQMGPGEFLSGQGVDVRPHPHIGLSTVTYLFEGTLDHKDSLGNDLRITPGDINLMTAGSGIVHSERTGQDVRQQPSKLFGIQSWLAQPLKDEDGPADFVHVPENSLPIFNEKGFQGRVILGHYLGEVSPIKTQWETLYLDMKIDKDAKALVPKVTEERALYILNGKIEIEGVTFMPQQLVILATGCDVVVRAVEETHLMIFGGAAMDGPRHIWWNFVASSRERLQQAKEDWRNGKFDKISGDESDFIPLP